MLPDAGWAEENLYTYKPGYYVLCIQASFAWDEDFRSALEKYVLKRINVERKKDERWIRPLEVQLHWKSPGGLYRNILYSDISKRPRP